MAKLMLVWDYDTPIARITATKPYNYVFEACLEEEASVDFILQTARDLGAKYTFAVVGFGAEKSVAPFDVRHVIQKIAIAGHEVASHSWKHEWLPFLTPYQLEKTIERSKFILEDCIGDNYKVNGFVLPHDRPMSWYSRGAFSSGDRALYPLAKGASIGGVANVLQKHNYRWVRVNYRPLWQKLVDWKGENRAMRLNRKFVSASGFHFVPEHTMEFGQPTLDALQWAVRHDKPLVVAGHPGAFSFRKENLDNFKRFIELVANHVDKKEIELTTISDYLNLQEHGR
ncbi:MAG: polysaccharide deacetylase family protein [Flavipsychrobacter sp.]|jgi:peptidoglycan/xylan/chitin deacetylase (PgdA/CDA1 family)|nr:polysaccharide deacetylase family protein [Flavipsychrobacter sp.]